MRTKGWNVLAQGGVRSAAGIEAGYVELSGGLPGCDGGGRDGGGEDGEESSCGLHRDGLC